MSRLSLSDADKKARDWFAETVSSMKVPCKVFTDEVGNQFAIRPGVKGRDTERVPATFVGSHLDTQPTGGRFDGVLGVCAGVEMLRVLDENWIETEGPVGVVNWTNEEGARFPMSMMGSGAWAEHVPLQIIWDLREVGKREGEARSVKEELGRIGYLGDAPASWEKGVRLGAHFELHIEQGPHLEAAGESVGVVQGVQAYKWFQLTITGRDCHTGTTAFEHRRDALYTAAELMVQFRSVAMKYGGLASVGIIEARPGSVNTVPGTVTTSLDVRHKEDDKLAKLLEAINAQIVVLSTKHTCEIDMKETFASSAVIFQKDAVACADAAAADVVGKSVGSVRRMISGAGHDSVFTSKKCPTSMIFINCRNGVSHHPEEWSSKEDCAAGASTLMGAALRFDQERYKRGDFD